MTGGSGSRWVGSPKGQVLHRPGPQSGARCGSLHTFGFVQLRPWAVPPAPVYATLAVRHRILPSTALIHR